MKKKMTRTKMIILGLIGLMVLGVGIFIFVDDIYPDMQRDKYRSILKKGQPFTESEIDFILKVESLSPSNSVEDHSISLTAEEYDKKRKIRNYELNHPQTEEEKEAELAWVREKVFFDTVESLTGPPEEYQRKDAYWIPETNVVYNLPKGYKQTSETSFQHQDKPDKEIKFYHGLLIEDEAELKSLATRTAIVLPRYQAKPAKEPEKSTYKGNTIYITRYDYESTSDGPWVYFDVAMLIEDHWGIVVGISSSSNNADELENDLNYLMDNVVEFEPDKLQKAIDEYYEENDPYGEVILDPSQLPEELR